MNGSKKRMERERGNFLINLKKRIKKKKKIDRHGAPKSVIRSYDLLNGFGNARTADLEDIRSKSELISSINWLQILL